jgi:hypothetical protein
MFWLGKICRKLSIPLPGRGYWARKRAGWPLQQAPLPPAVEGKQVEIMVPRRRQEAFLRRIVRPEEGEQRPEPPVIEVPERLDRPHRLVAQAAKLLKGRDSFNGYVSCWNVSCLNIHVTKPSLARTLRLMNALLKALEDRGYQVEVTKAFREEADRARYTDAPSNATRVLVAGEWIQFGIFEKQTMIRETSEPPEDLKGNALESWMLRNRRPVRYQPNGQLHLNILNCDSLGIRRTWGDSKLQTVEKCLGAFVVNLEVAAEAKKQERLEHERRERSGKRSAVLKRKPEPEPERRRSVRRNSARTWLIGAWRETLVSTSQRCVASQRPWDH